MKKTLLALTLSLAAGSAAAGCIGSGSFQTCTDSSGNSYSVNRIGNTTFTNGYNSDTGSTWNQTSTTIGNTTFHNGTAADGGTWHGTSTKIGDMTINSGTDSNGNSYHSTCTKYGCN
jgi:hypothetical protein